MLVLLFTVDFVLGRRPLLRTTRWEVKAATHDGKPLPAELYKALGAEVFFLYLNHSRWLAVDFCSYKRKRFLVFPDDGVHIFRTFPGTSPYLHHSVSGLYGIDILHPKIEEVWYLSDMGDTIVFSNEVFFVSMANGNSGRPPVEVHRNTRDAATDPSSIWYRHAEEALRRAKED